MTKGAFIVGVFAVLLLLIATTQSVYSFNPCLPTNCSSVGTNTSLGQCLFWNDGTNITGSGGEPSNNAYYKNRGQDLTASGNILTLDVTGDTNLGWNYSTQTGTHTIEYTIVGAATAANAEYFFAKNKGVYLTENVFVGGNDATGAFSANYAKPTFAITHSTYARVKAIADRATNIVNFTIMNSTGEEVTKLAGNYKNYTEPSLFELYSSATGVYTFTNITIYQGSQCPTTLAAPIITNVANGSVTQSSTTISWATDRNSNTTVNYGTTVSLGTKVTTEEAVTAHSKILTGLDFGTLYYYNVTSCTSSLCSESGTYNFTTPSYANFSITAANGTSGVAVSNFVASIDGLTYTSSGGQVVTHILQNNTNLFSISVNASGFLPFIASNVNVSTNYIANMTQKIFMYLAEYPPNNTQYNTSPLLYNVTFNNSNTQTAGLFVQCNLYINGLPMDNPYGSFNGTGTLSTTDTTTGNITYYWNCTNGEGMNISSETRTIFVDAVSPNIATTFSNNSVHHSGRNLTAYFNFTDDQSVYQWNISINGVNIAGNTTAGGTLFESYYLNKQVIGVGVMNITARVADGHTAQYIDAFDSVGTCLLGDCLEFKDNNKKVKIQEKDASLSDKWAATKETDRYTFKYTPSDSTEVSKTFVITCDDQLNILENENTKFKKWIVCGDKWIDFKVKNMNRFDISVLRTSPFRAEVTIADVKGKKTVEFESIGELNVYTKTYYFNSVNATAAFVASQTETHIQSNYLYINKTAVVNTSANFYFNNTNITSILKTESSLVDTYNATFETPVIPDGNYEVKWNYTIYNDINSVSGILNASQAVNGIIISNCSLPNPVNATSHIIRVFSLTTGNRLLANISGAFNIWGGTNKSLALHNYNLSWSNVYNATLCILSDNDEGIIYDSSMTFRSDGYSNSLLSKFNESLTLTTTVEDLFMTTSTTSVIIKITDQVSNPLQGYSIEQQLWDTATLSWKSISSQMSDSNGNSLFYYVATEQYRFLVTDPSGALVFDSGKAYIVQSPTTFKITLPGATTTPDIDSVNAWKVRTNLYNISSLIYFEWISTSGTGTICMNVTYKNMTSYYLLANNCSSAMSGTMSYNFSGLTSGMLKSNGYVLSNGYILNTLVIQLDHGLNFFNYIGQDGWIVYMILMILAIAVTITNIVAMPWALAIMHCVAWWLGLIPITYGVSGIMILIGWIIISVRLSK